MVYVWAGFGLRLGKSGLLLGRSGLLSGKSSFLKVTCNTNKTDRQEQNQRCRSHVSARRRIVAQLAELMGVVQPNSDLSLQIPLLIGVREAEKRALAENNALGNTFADMLLLSQVGDARRMA